MLVVPSSPTVQWQHWDPARAGVCRGGPHHTAASYRSPMLHSPPWRRASWSAAWHAGPSRNNGNLTGGAAAGMDMEPIECTWRHACYQCGINWRSSHLTRGLGIAANPTSDHLNPQEATNQDDLEVGADGAGLACPGSSVVADED